MGRPILRALHATHMFICLSNPNFSLFITRVSFLPFVFLFLSLYKNFKTYFQFWKTHSKFFFQNKKKIEKYVPKYLFKSENRNLEDIKKNWGVGKEKFFKSIHQLIAIATVTHLLAIICASIIS
jgi:hypothetical protein